MVVLSGRMTLGLKNTHGGGGGIERGTSSCVLLWGRGWAPLCSVLPLGLLLSVLVVIS